jgi:hypothetical protein
MVKDTFLIRDIPVSLDYSDYHSIKSGQRQGEGRGRVKYVFLGLWQRQKVKKGRTKLKKSTLFLYVSFFYRFLKKYFFSHFFLLSFNQSEDK